jgi:DNA-binding response OmpR family regulator
VARVLIVDDEVDLAETYCMFLEALDHECLVVTDPARALSVAVREKPEIVILDLRMPNVSGLDLASEIRSALGPGNVGLLLVTGNILDDAQRADAKDHGVDDCLAKPVYLDLLAEKIDLLVTGVAGERGDAGAAESVPHTTNEEEA